MAGSAHDSPEVPSQRDTRFRWQALFQNASEPIFILNRHRRLVFVNRAWENLTGFVLAEVRGRVCRRRPRSIRTDKLELVLAALAPPQEVMAGQTGEARRLVAFPSPTSFWHLAYFPLAAADGRLAIVGKISVLGGPEGSKAQPLSEKMLALRRRHLEQFRLEELVGETPAVLRLREQIRLAAQTRLPLLFVGARGSGKHWTARAIHASSAQKEKSFCRLDCARLEPQTVADLLFGNHLPPDVGAIYLRDLAALPRDIQERLVQWLQTEDETFPRLYAGLNEPPENLLRAGKLLNDLYCRISPLTIHLPHLKEHMADFALLGERLLARATAAAERDVKGLSPDAVLILQTYAWPENLRELYEVLVGACLHAKGDIIEAGDLPFHLRHAPVMAEKSLPLDAILAQVERRLIEQALRLAKNNKSRAAELLAIWRARLLRRMENLGIKEE